MKIKVTEKSYEEVMALPREKRMKPKRPAKFFRWLMKTLGAADLKATDFTYTEVGMERLGAEEPCLYLMNHSSFIDLEMVAEMLYPKPFNIVCTSDGFVGKSGLMRSIGCIPTRKFVTDMALVKDMVYALHTLKDSVLMYPEASYSFDGTATPLPESLGKCLKMLKVPVVMIRTSGAFARDPLYNNLQKRAVKVSAEMKYLLSPEEIAEKSTEELYEILRGEFTFDNFRWQQENDISVTEGFRADFLNRVLYKCPHCKTEQKMRGHGIKITCGACEKGYELTEKGFLKAEQEESIFTHVPDWYAWERACVRKELEENTYRLEVPVEIHMMVDTRSIYKVGTGTLTHSREGFTLEGCDGKLSYTQKPSASYSLYSDYFWYELGDMICIGNTEVLYYCFPTDGGDVVAKTRLAAEELYKLHRKK